MTTREIDTFVFGITFGVPLGAWLGYKLRRAIERVRKHREDQVSKRVDAWKKAWPAGSPMALANPAREQNVRRVLKRQPRLIPLTRQSDQDKIVPASLPVAPSGVSRGDLHWSNPENPANVTARLVRDEVVAALVGAGYKKVAALVAVDACSAIERASGVEQWTIAALHHAMVSK